MKKTLFLIAVVLLALAAKPGQAQSFDGGLTAGVVASQIDGDGYGGFHQLGWTGGFFVRIPSDGPGSWQMELRYTLLGAHSDVKEVDNGMLPMDVRLHYTELPILYRYDLSKCSLNGTPLDFITLEAGLSAVFLISGRQSTDFEDPDDERPWLPISALGHLGVQIDLDKHWGVNLRYLHSVTPCRWNLNSPSLFYGHQYNVALTASLSYTFIHLGN
ncbi:MAG: PorT family protein [Bacteroidales bacterium]|nr:PorT family protein [Bacteroidales bacterium]